MARSPRKHVSETGRVTWRVRYRLGGKETSETFPREDDAKMFARMLGRGESADVAEALSWLASKQRDSHAQTFADWFDSWAEQLTGITPRTRADYHALHRRYLTELDLLPLPLIGRAHIAAIVNRLEREGKSPKTIKNTIHMLSSVMALAVEEGLIPRNPVRRVRLPKARLNEHEVQFLTHDEVGRLIAATTPYYQPLVAFLAGTGMRWSEATALLCRSVDLENGTVRVDRAWKRVPGGWEIGPPKSGAGRRTVNAATLALVAVAPLMRGPNDLVFTTPTGRPVRHNNFFSRVWQPAVKAAGLDPAPSPHTLRHAHASWLLSDGQSIEAVQDQLGHEDLGTTRKVYAHLLPAVGVEVGRSASAGLERALAGVDGVQLGRRALEARADPDEGTQP